MYVVQQQLSRRGVRINFSRKAVSTECGIACSGRGTDQRAATEIRQDHCDSSRYCRGCFSTTTSHDGENSSESCRCSYG
jgi:hypothetical protein